MAHTYSAGNEPGSVLVIDWLTETFIRKDAPWSKVVLKDQEKGSMPAHTHTHGSKERKEGSKGQHSVNSSRPFRTGAPQWPSVYWEHVSKRPFSDDKIRAVFAYVVVTSSLDTSAMTFRGGTLYLLHNYSRCTSLLETAPSTSVEKCGFKIKLWCFACQNCDSIMTHYDYDD